MTPKLKNRLFQSIFVLLILLLIIFIELLLRLFHIGINTEPFIKTKYVSGAYINNPEFIGKYNSQTINHDLYNQKYYNYNIFDYKKADNVKRIFIVGESTPQGFPFEVNHSFSKITESVLNKIQKKYQFEIINISHTAMSSYYVADIVKKLNKFNPDLIVVYSGHNEYYGTISISTSKNYWMNKLYLIMKESYIFQNIFSLLYDKTYLNDDSLMHRLAGNKPKYINGKIDTIILTNYIKNIDSTIKYNSKHHIKSLIIQPICNILDMPPFEGQFDDRLIKIFTNNVNYINTMTNQRLIKKYNLLSLYPELIQNANVMYLEKFTANNKLADYSNKLLARDLDCLPFRAKKIIQEGLNQYFKYKTNDNIHYLPLYSEMANDHGYDIFGNKIFLEHVHLNMNGQIMVSQYLAKSIAQIYDIKVDELSKYYQFDIITNLIHYTALNEMIAYNKIEHLIKKYPFNQMMIPFNYDDSIMRKNIIKNNKQIISNIITSSTNGVFDEFEIIQIVLDYYNKNRSNEEYFELLMSFFSLYPGSYWPYILLARFYSTVPNQNQLSINFYKMGYFLSEKDEKIYNEFYHIYPDEALKTIKLNIY